MDRNNCRLIFMIVCLLFVLSNIQNQAFCDTPEVLFPRNIRQVTWINNNEILISDFDDDRKTRIMKFNIKKNQFIPVRNCSFANNESISFDGTGKKFLTYDYSTKKISLEDKDYNSYKVDISTKIVELSGEQDCNKYKSYIDIIKIFNECAIVQLFVQTFDVIEVSYLYLNFDEKFKFIKDKNFITQIYDRNNDSLFYFINNTLFEYRCSENITNKVYEFQDNIEINQVVKYKNEYYVVGYFENILLRSKNIYKNLKQWRNLYTISSQSKNFRRILKGVDSFDISENYLVTTFTWYEPGSNNEVVTIFVCDKNLKPLYKENVNRKPRRNPNIPDIIPMISPDERLIVILQCYSPKYPLIYYIDKNKIYKK